MNKPQDHRRTCSIYGPDPFTARLPVNLKAELEIRHLHEEVDHLLSHQWDRLVQIQELQLDLLAELGRPR